VEIEVKFTADARVVSTLEQELHTECMFVLMPEDGSHGEWQSPQYHYTLAVYLGKDDAEGLRRNFGALFEEAKRLERDGFVEGAYTVKPNFVWPADMATHWAMYNCGGVHDKEGMPCHRCTCKMDERQCIFEWYDLKRSDPSDTRRWTLDEAASHLHLHVADLVWLNTQQGELETTLQEHHKGFVFPELEGVPEKPTHGMDAAHFAALQEQHRASNNALLEAARGRRCDAAGFSACIRGFLRPAAVLADFGVTPPPTHDGTEWCECPWCTRWYVCAGNAPLHHGPTVA